MTGIPYDLYIRDKILVPAGMMHTRIGPRLVYEYSLFDSVYLKQNKTIIDIDSQYLHTVIDPHLLDSTLGWYSNIYDLSRFVRCLFGRHLECQLLRPESVHYMTEKPPFPHSIHDNQWRAISIHATLSGAIWQDSDTYDNDVIMYHQGAVRGPFFRTLTNDLDSNKDNVTFIALMSSNKYQKFKNTMKK